MGRMDCNDLNKSQKKTNTCHFFKTPEQHTLEKQHATRQAKQHSVTKFLIKDYTMQCKPNREFQNKTKKTCSHEKKTPQAQKKTVTSH